MAKPLTSILDPFRFPNLVTTCNRGHLSHFVLAVFITGMGLSSASVDLVYAANFVVNTTDDNTDGAGCNTTHCSLREAMLAANSSPGGDTITFNVGTTTILPASPLPTLTDSNTIIKGAGSITLDGTGAGVANGILIHSSHNRVQGLIISGFNRSGILIEVTSPTGTATNNIIGTDGNGTDDNLEGNVIINNGGSGIRIEDRFPSPPTKDVKNNVVAGNYIGVGANGITAAPNGSTGVGLSRAWHNRIGTDGDNKSDALERNVISANGAHGIFIGHGSQHNTVAGNYVGTATDGDAPLGNSASGVAVYFADYNTIGEGNVISNNGSNGVSLGAASYNVVIGNRIGTDVSGTQTRGNDFNGVRIFGLSSIPSNFNHIGFINQEIGTAPKGNVIAHNVWNGIWVDSHAEGFTAINNAFLYNSIYSNNLLGIDLVPNTCQVGGCTDGVSPNDGGDTDGGGNNALNYPDIVSASTGFNFTYVRTEINNGLPNTLFTIQFFSSPECDPAGHGEGQTYLGQVDIGTNNAGDISAFTTSLPVTVPVGDYVTSTATSVMQPVPTNTSEFSACVQVVSAAMIILEHAKELLKVLFASNQFGEEEARTLNQLLDTAIRQAELGDEQAALDQMRMFVRKVKNLVRSGKISKEASHRLIDATSIM